MGPQKGAKGLLGKTGELKNAVGGCERPKNRRTGRRESKLDPPIAKGGRWQVCGSHRSKRGN